jgi:hypothetical protein
VGPVSKINAPSCQPGSTVTMPNGQKVPCQ